MVKNFYHDHGLSNGKIRTMAIAKWSNWRFAVLKIVDPKFDRKGLLPMTVTICTILEFQSNSHNKLRRNFQGVIFRVGHIPPPSRAPSLYVDKTVTLSLLESSISRGIVFSTQQNADRGGFPDKFQDFLISFATSLCFHLPSSIPPVIDEIIQTVSTNHWRFQSSKTRKTRLDVSSSRVERTRNLKGGGGSKEHLRCDYSN